MSTTRDLLQNGAALAEAWADLTDDELAVALADFGDATDDKIDRLRHVALAAQADADRAKAVAASYAAEATRKARVLERVKACAVALMRSRRQLGLPTKIAGVASLVGNGGKTPLILPDGWADTAPAAYVVVRKEPNGDLIRAALEAGKDIPGAKLGERGEHVRFAGGAS